MYKLLLVSDQEEVLNAFGQIQNWERQGFKPPHIRYDYDGMLDSLSKHHADGIAVRVVPELRKKKKRFMLIFRSIIRTYRSSKREQRRRWFSAI